MPAQQPFELISLPRTSSPTPPQLLPATLRAVTRHPLAFIFDGVGHDLMLDVSWQTVAHRIERFLRDRVISA